MKKTKLIIPAIIALGAGVVANTYADTASTDFSITVNPSASITVSAASLNLNMTPTQAGVYDSGTLTVTASTNNTTGYTLVLETNNTALESNTINPNTGSKPTIPSIAESQDGITAAAFAASTDSNVLNHWGLAIGSANFNAIKASQTLKTTNAPAVSDATVLTMASKLDLLTVPGVYSTTLNFEMTTNPLPDTLESAYAKANKQKATIDGKSYYAIQDMNSTICADVDILSELQVYDNRDNHIYTIGKLADDHCWLLDNLALDPTDTNTTMNANNTNATAEAITNFLEGSASAPSAGWSTSPVAIENGSSAYDAPLFNKTNKDIVPTDSLSTSGGWKVGIYYNFCAASVGTYCYAGGASGQSSHYNVAQDICPSGWRLPTYTPSTITSEYETLYNRYPTIPDVETQYSRFRNALHLPLSGYSSGSIMEVNNINRAWEATTNGNYNAYYSYTGTSSVSPMSDTARNNAQSVRCIAK